MHIFYINILIFNFLRLLHVSNPRVHLQEDGSIYSYGTVRFTGISISSLVSWRMRSKHAEDKEKKIKI